MDATDCINIDPLNHSKFGFDRAACSTYARKVVTDMLREESLMLNPSRSLIMLRSIDVKMMQLGIRSKLEVKLKTSEFDRHGKRGFVNVEFEFLDDTGLTVGAVTKMVLISGLEKYNDETSAHYLNSYQGILQAQRHTG